MIFSSPIPRARQPTFHEGSALRSLRDSDSTARQWLRSQTQGHDVNASARAMFFISQKLARQRRRLVGGGGASGGSTLIPKQWNPTDSWKAGQIVFFTPASASAATFYAIQDVAPGIQPDTGSPNWGKFPSGAPGMWL